MRLRAQRGIGIRPVEDCVAGVAKGLQCQVLRVKVQMPYGTPDVHQRPAANHAQGAQVEWNVEEEALGMRSDGFQERERISHVLEDVEHHQDIVLGVIARQEVTAAERYSLMPRPKWRELR